MVGYIHFTQSWRAALVMSVVRIMLLLLGLIAVVFGGAMYTVNQEFLESCYDPPGLWLSTREDPVHEENCRVASGNVLFGVLSMIIGIVLISLSVVAFISARRNRMKATQNCPQCHTTITWRSSPKNCSNCGSTIEWKDA
jgi:uncharacterized membrane protein